MSKYGNIQSAGCSYGFSHRSKLEYAVCQLIWLREKAGELKHIQHECNIHLTKARVLYIPDFKCETRDGLLFIEAKGYEAARWPTIKKLWKHYGPGPLEIWKGMHRRPILDETIIPVGGDE